MKVLLKWSKQWIDFAVHTFLTGSKMSTKEDLDTRNNAKNGVSKNTTTQKVISVFYSDLSPNSIACEEMAYNKPVHVLFDVGCSTIF